jgi:hypothetical protein
VYETLKKMPKDAACAIDGWTRNLLMSAITVDHSIAEDLGVILAMIASTTQHAEAPRQQQQQQEQQQQNQNQNFRNNAARQNNNNNNKTNSKETWCRYFDELTMEMLRAARLVGIPKPDGKSYRPIVVSSFFSKLTGACLLRRADL